jgi:hypothetical protein
MPAIQPPFLPCYFSFRTDYALPEGLAENHYLSWEDALWDIIDIYKIKKGSVVLIPTFWCMDVVKNIGEHGLRCEHYPMDANFQTSEDELIQAIQKYHPAIIIIFHAVGIRNNLMTTNCNWIKKISDHQFVIEDSVHSIIDPREIIIKRDRHFVIDSWRKVIPLQGATIYGKKIEISKFLHTHKSFSMYSLRIIWLWMRMQWWLVLSSLEFPNYALRLVNLKTTTAKKAEKDMLDAYDLIGDSATSCATLWPFIFLRKHINTSYIKDIKRRQVIQYENLLEPLWTDKRFIRIQIQNDDFGELRGYPVALALSDAKQMIHALRESGVLVRSELEDSPWTQLRKVIYLPLGPYLGSKDIQEVCKELLQVRSV